MVRLVIVSNVQDKPSKPRPSTAGRPQVHQEESRAPAAGPETLGGLRSKSANNVKKDLAPPPQAPAAFDASRQSAAPIDWFSVELPPGWERRVHNANGKVSCSFFWCIPPIFARN